MVFGKLIREGIGWHLLLGCVKVCLGTCGVRTRGGFPVLLTLSVGVPHRRIEIIF